MLGVALVAGRSVVVERRAASPLRLLCPRNAGGAAWTYTSTFGGGLVDGDDVRLRIEVGDGASALVATQASTKAYRSPSGARQAVEAIVGEDALLVVLSDPLVPFAGARIDALLDVELGRGATLAAVEGLTAGRVALGERWAAARCQTRLRVRREGAPVLDDALLLDPAHGAVPARMGPFDAWANVVLLGPGVRGAASTLLARSGAPHRLAPDVPAIELAAPLEGGCLLRIAAASTAILNARVREALTCVAPLLGDDPFTRRW
jgi:urease accessory protein